MTCYNISLEIAWSLKFLSPKIVYEPRREKTNNLHTAHIYMYVLKIILIVYIKSLAGFNR